MTSPIPPLAHRPGRRHVADRLNDEWARHCADPDVAGRVRAWPAPLGGPAMSLPDVLDHCGGDRDVDLDRADAALAALVALARTDDLAARTVLQRIVPGLVGVARRRQHHGGLQQAFDDAVATAWLVIRTYPIERRPRRVAAGLCRDTEYQAFVRPHRLRSADERPHGMLHLDRAGRSTTPDRPGARRVRGAHAGPGVMRAFVPAAAEEVRALLVDAALAGIDPASLALVVRLHLEGCHPRLVADELAVSERTVRNRRDAVVRRLVSLVAAA